MPCLGRACTATASPEPGELPDGDDEDRRVFTVVQNVDAVKRLP